MYMATLIPDYKQLWNTMEIKQGVLLAAEQVARRISKGRLKYEEVSALAAGAVKDGSHCPWYFIGLTHLMECSLSWKKHLHNGDPLIARTVNVPIGRPKSGNPPFTWKQSAIDVIRYMDLNSPYIQWDFFLVLEKLEKYNGLGYRKHGIYSPYLWAGTNHYIKGKYVKDGKFDPEAVSSQVGCAAILRFLI